MTRPAAAWVLLLALSGCGGRGPEFQHADPSTNAALSEAANEIDEGDGGEPAAVQRERDRIGDQVRAASRHRDPKLP